MQQRFFLLAVLLGTAVGISAADITGKITLKGTPPPGKDIPIGDPTCGKAHPNGLKTRFYIVSPDGGLADVFVYIKDGLSGKTFNPPEKPVVLDQKGCEYSPYVFGAQTGQKIVVKNSDPLMHNVHVEPMVEGNKPENKAQLPNGPDLNFTWQKPEVFLKFRCDVHPWMFSYLGLVDHPFFAVTDKEGNFKITNVPPGKYVVEAFHRKAGKVTNDVTVGAENQKTDFTIEVK